MLFICSYNHRVYLVDHWRNFASYQLHSRSGWLRCELIIVDRLNDSYHSNIIHFQLMLSGAYGLVIHCIEPIHYSDSRQRPRRVWCTINLLMTLITIVCMCVAMIWGGIILRQNYDIPLKDPVEFFCQIVVLVFYIIGFSICCCLLIIICTWNHKSNSANRPI